jgi:hypothetical protein
MRKSSVLLGAAIAFSATMFVPLGASAQDVSIYIGPGYPGYSVYPGYYSGYPAYGAYPSYSYAYPSYGYAYPNYEYYGRPYVGTYWGQGRRVARRVNRRWDRWD